MFRCASPGVSCDALTASKASRVFQGTVDTAVYSPLDYGVFAARTGQVASVAVAPCPDFKSGPPHQEAERGAALTVSHDRKAFPGKV